jgi:hypothetical protein
MATGYKKETRYKVLDVREDIGNQSKPIVLICEEHEHPPRRRRIEIDPSWAKAYNTALWLVPGDHILVFESYNVNGIDHTIDDIEC